MEKAKLINSFSIPVIDCEGCDYSDDLVEVYELVDVVHKGPSGEPSDFTIEKEAVLVDKYHLNKVLQERAKGADLKSIIARCEKTGDLSALNARSVVYGDGFVTPSSLGEALDKAKEGEKYLDSLSQSEIERLIYLSKLPKADFDSYIESLAKKSEPVSQVSSSSEEGGQK